MTAPEPVVDADPQPNVWLTRPEVAQRLRIGVVTLEHWASSGVGPPYRRFGKFARYKLSELIAWEDEQSGGGEAS